MPFAEVAGGAAPARTPAASPVAANQWTYLAVTADGKNLTVYVNGKQAAQAAATLPALNAAATIGADATGAPAGFAAYSGVLDELRLSKIARSPAAIAVDALAQGSESKLVAYGADEKQSGFGFGYFGVIVQSVTVDAGRDHDPARHGARVVDRDVDEGALRRRRRQGEPVFRAAFP